MRILQSLTRLQMGLALALLGVALALLPLGLSAIGYELSPKQGYSILILAALFVAGAVIVFFWPWIKTGWAWLRRDAEIRQLNTALTECRQKLEELRTQLQEVEQGREELQGKLGELASLEAENEWESAVKTPIIGKTYRNERVELDGFSYSNCRFVHVTFVFKGEKPFDLAHNTIEGGYNLVAPSPQLQALLSLLAQFNYLNPEAKVYGGEDEN